MLDDRERRRYCLIIFAGCTRSPLHIARRGACSNRRSQATVRSSLLKPHPGRLFVRRHVRKPTIEPDCPFGLRPGADPAIEVIVAIITTLPRRYACQKSMRREMRSARPLTVNNSGIDARNGQAYHGRKTIATNGTRPAVLGSRASKGQREKWRWRRPLTSRVRPSPGAAGRTRMLRVGAEAAIDASSMR